MLQANNVQLYIVYLMYVLQQLGGDYLTPLHLINKNKHLQVWGNFYFFCYFSFLIIDFQSSSLIINYSKVINSCIIIKDGLTLKCRKINLIIIKNGKIGDSNSTLVTLRDQNTFLMKPYYQQDDFAWCQEILTLVRRSSQN